VPPPATAVAAGDARAGHLPSTGYAGVVEGPGMTGVIDARARQVGVSYAEMAKTHLGRVIGGDGNVEAL
jgi:hypothetical protein